MGLGKSYQRMTCGKLYQVEGAVSAHCALYEKHEGACGPHPITGRHTLASATWPPQPEAPGVVLLVAGEPVRQGKRLRARADGRVVEETVFDHELNAIAVALEDAPDSGMPVRAALLEPMAALMIGSFAKKYRAEVATRCAREFWCGKAHGHEGDCGGVGPESQRPGPTWHKELHASPFDDMDDHARAVILFVEALVGYTLSRYHGHLPQCEADIEGLWAEAKAKVEYVRGAAPVERA